MNPKRALLLRRQRVAQQLPPLTEVVRGSLVERRLRCGKPTCHCARGDGHHVWYLTVSFARGRTEQITVPERLVPAVQQWLQNYHRWWDSLEEISAINRELLRQRWLDASPAPRGPR
ncbi:MAG: hypothetical protein HYY85_09100 [Deltaproteobacteria bacterium]|nr:hypothetical protein [Deltaproteobacteria bacterium]